MNVKIKKPPRTRDGFLNGTPRTNFMLMVARSKKEGSHRLRVEPGKVQNLYGTGTGQGAYCAVRRGKGAVML